MTTSQMSLTVTVVFLSLTSLRAQQQAVLDPSAREDLRSSAWLYGYPRGMLQHTAMLHTITTRYQLLRAATDCKELSSFLNLTDEQLEIVRRLNVVSEDVWFEHNKDDLNAQPDEQYVEPKYFDFLQAEQVERLDFVAFWFDGYASLSRSSIAERLRLAPETRQRIAEAIANIRDNVVIPNSWRRFGGPQPKDGDYMDCYFAGAWCAQLNLQIIEILSDDECSRLHAFLDSTYEPIAVGDLIAAVRKRARLPDGVLALAEAIVDDDETASWPTDSTELISHLNEWNQSQLTLYNEPQRFPGRAASRETAAWVQAHEKKLAELKVTIRWDHQQKKYVESVSR